MSERLPHKPLVLEIDSESSEERLASFLTQYGKPLLLAAGLLIALLLGGYLWHAASRGEAEGDYLLAETSFQQLTKVQAGETSLADNPSFVTLKKMLAKHPELGARYDGPLAQTLLKLGDVPLAVVYADLALKELAKENMPFYEEYAKTSLLIAQGDYRDAFKRASFLQKRMKEEMQTKNSSVTRGFSPQLFLANQLRLAALLQQLDLPAEELKAWQEVEQLAASSHFLDEVKVGEVPFLQFVRAREAELKEASSSK